MIDWPRGQFASCSLHFARARARGVTLVVAICYALRLAAATATDSPWPASEFGWLDPVAAGLNSLAGCPNHALRLAAAPVAVAAAAAAAHDSMINHLRSICSSHSSTNARAKVLTLIHHSGFLSIQISRANFARISRSASRDKVYFVEN